MKHFIYSYKYLKQEDKLVEKKKNNFQRGPWNKTLTFKSFLIFILFIKTQLLNFIEKD